MGIFVSWILLFVSGLSLSQPNQQFVNCATVKRLTSLVISPCLPTVYRMVAEFLTCCGVLPVLRTRRARVNSLLLFQEHSRGNSPSRAHEGAPRSLFPLLLTRYGCDNNRGGLHSMRKVHPSDEKAKEAESGLQSLFPKGTFSSS